MPFGFAGLCVDFRLGNGHIPQNAGQRFLKMQKIIYQYFYRLGEFHKFIQFI
jgi:hypothetical protein